MHLDNNGAAVGSSTRSSRRRSRLSERRKLLARMSSSHIASGDQCDQRSVLDADSPAGPLAASGPEGAKISMKIQYHIAVAPDNEPLVLDAHQLLSDASSTPPTSPPVSAPANYQPSAKRLSSSEPMSSAIGEHISDRLQRQSSSTRRRQQLLALHAQSALTIDGHSSLAPGREPRPLDEAARSDDNLAAAAAALETRPLAGREPGARSSTVTGGIQDEATARFLAGQRQQRQSSAGSLVSQHQALTKMSSPSATHLPHQQRKHIFFKRDGQRFGQEFTLKLAVDKSYRCLIKVRPLIPLQAISIQGHHVAFVDCSSNSGSFASTGSSSTTTTTTTASSGLGSLSSSAPGLGQAASQSDSAASLRHQSIAGLSGGAGSPRPDPLVGGARQQNSAHHRRLNHAQTTICSNWRNESFKRAKVDQTADAASQSAAQLHRKQLQLQLLRQQQHHQMMRQFSPVTSSSHAGSQLVYMFDWSAGRFEVNKNKARTEVQTVLKFQNGQILSLPLQVKFYEPDSRQHLSWGNQLHFIDYDCNIDTMGQMKVDKIQYY